MRLSFLLVVAAIVLLSSGTAMAKSSEVEGRRLRVHKSTSDEHEERGFNADKFNRLMNDENYRGHRFANWMTKGYTDTAIYNKLRVGSYPIYSRILNYYKNYLGVYAPRLISP